MTTVRVTPVEQDDPDDEWMRFAFRYDPELVSIVKGVSLGLRTYEPDTKSWLVMESVAEQVIDEMQAAGHTVVSGNEPPPPALPEVSVESFFGGVDGASTPDRAMITALADRFVEAVPAHLAHRVFRAVARRLYPEIYDRTK